MVVFTLCCLDATESSSRLDCSWLSQNPYCEWGRADAPRTVICVHGLTRNGRDFDKLAEALSAEGTYRVLAVDVVGRGQSDWVHDPLIYNYPQYLADMNALIAR